MTTVSVKCLLACMVISLTLAAAPARAEMEGDEVERALGLYTGLGYLAGTVDSQHPSIGKQSAEGVLLYVGIPFGRFFSIETAVGTFGGLETGPTPDIYYPPDTAEYSCVSFGFKVNAALDAIHPFVPWVGAGVTYENIEWGSYMYSLEGSGSYTAAGLDAYVAKWLSLRAEYRKSSFTGTTPSFVSEAYMTDVTSYGLSATFHFDKFGNIARLFGF